ncbi:MAG: TatD family hydrolase [Bacteroidales bacterium]|nr:TatD family hydrolase [Bacteroidales bacterium]
MVDTHSHIFDPVFDDDRMQVIQRALDNNVTKVLLANVDSSTIEQMYATAEQYPMFCAMAMGLHPTSVVPETMAQELQRVQDELEKHREKFCAVGEIGIDLYWDATYLKQQQMVFETQLDWAKYYDLPVLIHTRKAYAETFQSLQRVGGNRGVMHCFGGGIEEAKKSVALGFCLGVGGVLTYKNSHLDEILRPIGLNHLVLETDAPYLPPTPHRGKRNEPQYVPLVAQKLAEVFNTTLEEVDRTTTATARDYFPLALF